MSNETKNISILRFDKPAMEAEDMSSRLNRMIRDAVGSASYEDQLISPDNSSDVSGKRLLVAVDSDEIGGHPELYKWLRMLYKYKRESGKNPLEGTTAGILVNSDSPLYTKRLAQYAIFHMNRLGCRFIGHPLVEAVDNLQNFMTWKKVVDASLESILESKCQDLGKRLTEFKLPQIRAPKLLVLHSSSHTTSNTLQLWSLVEEHLGDFETREFRIEDNKIAECKGCSFKTCMHYSEIKSCYYGGMMVEEVLPAMEWADAVIWVCPNYNDAISAKLMAVINRMTVLYRRMTFYDKRLFGIVVSGNSGSDLVITQLLGALNINKGYMLPPEFAFSEIANDPGSIMEVEGIREHALSFAKVIQREFGFDE